MNITFALRSRLVLIIASLLLSWMVGIGVYQNCVVIPSWFEAPPASFARINQYGKTEIRFWIPMQILTVCTLIAALLVHWHEPARRPPVLAALLCYLVAVAVTAAYLAPRIVAWGKIGPGDVIAEGVRAAVDQWRALSWIRQCILIAADFLLLCALAT